MDESVMIARAATEPHRAQLVGMYNEAWRQWELMSPEHRAIIGKSSRTLAGIIWSFVTHEATKYFMGLQITPRVQVNTVTFPIGGRVVLRFKKTDHTGRSSNYRTRRSQKYNRGEPLIDTPELIRVDVGWVLNDAGTGIASVLLALPGDRCVRWREELTNTGLETLDLFGGIDEDDRRLIRPRDDEAQKGKEDAGA